MTSDRCQQMRTLLGMYVLGRLGDTETAALLAHLDGCRVCRAELSELTPVAAALGQADPDRLGEPAPTPPPTLPDTIFAGIDRERGRRRYRRAAALAGAAVVALGLLTGGFFLRGLVPAGNPGQQVSFTVNSAGVVASAEVENRAWGTGISLDVTGLPQGERYNVWLQRPDGSRMNAGSFIAGGDRKMSMQLAVGLPMSDATMLGVSAPGDDRPLLAANLPT
ncbi:MULTISPECIES: anti-sigma factor [unclassified Rhodococcus (in: high G+C Gram-positive bacteria)]|uniref:anti-sigma factor family protein n=1 Tax=unclassified Rhodococcus (in: high G+C Gram-positive bacteria) TaxID=192944 RepID=UPI002078C3F7|nr:MULTISPECIES: zf-HC2 domain-containing protein [unclassified Rhodococcus (in: high G+C Gram-positive bacteria)]